MAVEEGRRIALHGAAAESWGEEVADTLMESIAPSGHELATRQDIDGILAAMDAMDERWEERLTTLDQRWDDRLTAMDQRWNDRLTGMDERWQAEGRALRAELVGTIERRVGDAITAQTRLLIISFFVALVAIAGLAFGMN